jgi:hypothetical protein
MCEPLITAIAAPPAGSELLARRAIEILAEATTAVALTVEGAPPPPKAAPVALVAAAEAGPARYSSPRHRQAL